MKEFLILTVGKNDVEVGNRSLFPPHIEGKRVWDNWDEFADKITLPLIEPILDELAQIIKYNIDPSKKLTDLAKIFVIATRQKTEDFYPAQKDTIWFARIIAKLLETRWRIRSTKIEIVIIENLDFDGIVKANRKLEKVLKQADHIYVKLDGCLPALGFILGGRLILNFRHKVKIIRVSHGSKAVEDFLSVDHLLRAIQIRNALFLSSNFQYSACMQIFDEEEDLYRVFRFLTAWKNMDYELSEFLFRNNLPKEFQNAFQSLLKTPRSHDDALKELYFNIDMQLAVGEYVDVLGRLYSFRENLLKYGLNRLVGYPLTLLKDQDSNLQPHRDFLQKNPELSAYLKAQKEGGEDLRYQEVSFRVLRAILRFSSKSDVRAKKIYSALNKLDEVLEYRNQTIIGHGFRGCSKAILEDKMKMDTSEIMVFLKNVLALADIRVGENPFQQVNEILQNKFGETI